MERESEKKRHGCLWVWLIVLAILDVVGVFGSLFMSQMGSINSSNPAVADAMAKAAAAMADLPGWWTPTLTMLALLKLGCVAAIFWWKKIGFWGLCVTAVISAAMAFTRLGHPAPPSRFNIPPFVGVIWPFVALAIWYGVLQIGKEDKGWPQLE